MPSLGLLTLPLDVAKATLELHTINDGDTKKLENVRILSEALSKGQVSIARTSSTSNSMSLGDTVRLLQEASKQRQRALARVGLRFGGSLTQIQAKRLRERGAAIKGKSRDAIITERLAGLGADTLEFLTNAISSIDRSLATRK